MIYILFFIISYIIAELSVCLKKKNIVFVYSGKVIDASCLMYLSSSIPVLLLATFRAVTIGTDNLEYARWYDVTFNIINFSDAVWKPSTDILYNILTYGFSRISSEYSLLCFFTSLITLIVLLWAIRLISNSFYISASYAYLIFLFMFYCNNLNLVRQGMALSICMLGLAFLYKEKILSSFLCIIIASLMHISSALFICIPFIKKYIDKGKYWQKLLMLIILFLLILLMLGPVTNMLIKLQVLDERFYAYSELLTVTPFSLKQTIVRLPIIIYISFYYSCVVSDKLGRGLYAFIWLDLIFCQLESIFGPLARISLYFQYAYIFLIPLVYSRIKGKWQKLVFAILSTIYIVVYFVYFSVFNGYGFWYPIYPYESN